LIRIRVAQSDANEFQGRHVTVGGNDEVIVGKLDKVWIGRSGDRRTNDLIQEGRISQCLNSQLHVGASGRQTKNTCIKINHIDLVRSGEKSLGKAVTLGVGPGGKCRGMRTAGPAFRDIGDIPGDRPGGHGARRIKRSEFEIAIA
jgi:hypothetical protein